MGWPLTLITQPSPDAATSRTRAANLALASDIGMVGKTDQFR